MIYFTNSYRVAVAAIAVLGLCLSVGTALGSTISYSMVMCEDLGVLVHPNDTVLAQYAAVKPQGALLLERTNPYIQLDNTSDDPDALLTQFTMSIGDASKNFDWAKLITASPGVTFSLESPDLVAGSLKNDLLVINFTNFKPGDFVRFRVGLSPDDRHGSMVIDYRNVLYHMNAIDTSHNSVLNVTFNSPAGSGVVTQQLPNFPNDNPFTSTDLRALTTRCGMDSIEPVTTGGAGTIPPVPEPGSIALLGIGLLGLSLLGMRRRRHLA
jgi:hypothetical protein